MDPHKLEALKAAGAKKVLDPRKLEALVGYVIEKCGATKKQIIKVVKAKLNYEDKAKRK